MSLPPPTYDRRYGELDQVLRAHLGRSAHDPAALDGYLRQTSRSRPWAVALAEEQLREFAENPPGRLRARLGEFYAMPDVGLPDGELRDWLLSLADRLGESLAEGRVPPPGVPGTHWEWHDRFPELGQLLGGWFGQGMPAEFGEHAAALHDYLEGTDPGVLAKLVGELHELLALPLDEPGLILAVAELGLEVAPPAPWSTGAWLEAVAAHLRTVTTPAES
ncbi:contact-dependent growth inhibition system immunity protein [Streptomyces sp. WAC01280]|uniref:contact-dependent growth inhibition system immunity protein n=1 Tax=Streptomyces sp. WAC01280 TaxID=2487424 RepID=UPI000F79CEBA|nr:contact-dependent growth inhibition system immunity protein [Streptomyces sp. WAC01280]RSS56759.1 hypothetical protein EF909_11785 [Streptomyces sp. WAC01280]